MVLNSNIHSVDIYCGSCENFVRAERYTLDCNEGTNNRNHVFHPDIYYWQTQKKNALVVEQGIIVVQDIMLEIMLRIIWIKVCIPLLDK